MVISMFYYACHELISHHNWNGASTQICMTSSQPELLRISFHNDIIPSSLMQELE